jgi:hypothetical protein
MSALPPKADISACLNDGLDHSRSGQFRHLPPEMWWIDPEKTTHEQVRKVDGRTGNYRAGPRVPQFCEIYVA